MNCLPTFQRADARKRGFTLIELMVAMAVLSLIMVMLAQIVSTVSTAWSDGQRRVNNFTKARGMLDMFARDIQSGVFRKDLAYFPKDSSGTNSVIAFYTQQPGYVGLGTVRNVSLVRYMPMADAAEKGTLQRADYAIKWDADPSAISFGSLSTLPEVGKVERRDTAPGIVAYKILFVYADGTTSTSYTPNPLVPNPLRAVALTLAVVDDQTMKVLSATSKFDTLSGQINASGVVTGTRSVKADWETYLRNPVSMDWNSYPKSLAVGLKIFERYVVLPNT